LNRTALNYLDWQAITYGNELLKANNGMWSDVNKAVLFNWELNMKKLMCEVLENGADIITLQEVDSFRSNGEYNLERQMAKLGYFGVHKEKPGR
jgi:mRNA deadenylase 3'-5' endonuclease subunit Ccr4